MTLKLIGVGFGRTGTSSTKLALEQLGIAPCHHMSDLVKSHTLSEKWYNVAFKQDRNWDKVFEGYEATIDWPSVSYWRELADYYPEAKLLLTVRDSEKWYDSMVKTVLPTMENPLGEEGSAVWFRRSTSIKLIKNDTFNGVGLTDREATIRRFMEHNAEVQAAFPSSRLLTWQVGDGWEPLGNFLDVPVPDTPFPHANTKADFSQMFKSDPKSPD